MASRQQLETHPIIGYLINAVPVRGKSMGSGGIEQARKWLSLVQDAAANSLPHGCLVRDIKPLRPHLQVMFQYLDTEDLGMQAHFGKLRSGIFNSEKVRLSHAKAEIFFHVNSKGYTIEYYNELFDESTIQNLADHLVGSLKSLVG